MKFKPTPTAAGLLIAALAWPSSDAVVAQDSYNPPYTKENISPVRVALRDGAVNGCWTNINEVKDYTEGQLELAGIEVTDENAARTYLRVKVLSERMQNGACYGNIEISLEGWVNWKDGRAYVQLASIDAPFSSAKNANTAILDTVKNYIGGFFAALPDGI